MTDLTHPNAIAVFAKAKEIVMFPETEYRYSDIGDVIVMFLRAEISSVEAIEKMNLLHLTYERARTQGKLWRF